MHYLPTAFTDSVSLKRRETAEARGPEVFITQYVGISETSIVVLWL